MNMNSISSLFLVCLATWVVLATAVSIFVCVLSARISHAEQFAEASEPAALNVPIPSYSWETITPIFAPINEIPS